MTDALDIADPRNFPDRVEPAFAFEIERAVASLASTSVSASETHDAALMADLIAALRASKVEWLSGLLDAAPSAAIARHLRRRLIAAWDEAVVGDDDRIATQVFALPVVIVAAKSSPSAPEHIDAVVPEAARLNAILIEHGALAGNRSFALAGALASADTIDVPRLPELLTWARTLDASGPGVRSVEPAAIALSAEGAVHLRFLIGAALAAPRAALLADSRVGAWGLPLAKELARQLAAPEASILALPRAPRAPLIALQEGRAAQREVAAQLFASNALRRLRSAVGEPAAVISAHRCPTACGGGELRLSLSSVFDSRQAEGFRCPLFPGERVGDVASMLATLMHDCRVADVQVLPSVHPDLDPTTGLTLLFKAESLAAEQRTTLQ